MTLPDNRFYLGLGSVFSETVTSKLSTSGSSYKAKLLQSGPANWQRICELLESPHLAGVVAKVTGRDYERLLQPRFAVVAADLLSRLGQVPHLVLVHEAVAGTPPTVDDEIREDDDEYYEDEEWNDRRAREYFGDMDPAVQARVHDLFERHEISVTTYKRNAEASILASAFVGDVQDNLIFRLYVPAGRIYEDELGRLLELFHHWLGAVKKANVRQGGYKTKNGRVIEFFGDGLSSPGMGLELAEFNHFLGLLEDPAAAGAMLVGLGVDTARVEALVTRYSKEARRVLIDARQERDRRILAVQQRLESELADEVLPVSMDQLAVMVHALIPLPPTSLTGRNALPASPAGSSVPTLVVNNQFIHRVEGIVTQNLEGGVHLGPEVESLLELIRSSNAADKLGLEDAAKQLADAGAPTAPRLAARQRLKDFLLRNGARVEASTFQALWDWLQGQVGG